MFRFLVAVAVLSPATSFACGMPAPHQAKVSLSELMDEIDSEAKPAPKAEEPPPQADVAPPEETLPAAPPVEPEPTT